MHFKLHTFLQSMPAEVAKAKEDDKLPEQNHLIRFGTNASIYIKKHKENCALGEKATRFVQDTSCEKTSKNAGLNESI